LVLALTIGFVVHRDTFKAAAETTLFGLSAMAALHLATRSWKFVFAVPKEDHFQHQSDVISLEKKFAAELEAYRRTNNPPTTLLSLDWDFRPGRENLISVTNLTTDELTNPRFEIVDLRVWREGKFLTHPELQQLRATLSAPDRVLYSRAPYAIELLRWEAGVPYVAGKALRLIPHRLLSAPVGQLTIKFSASGHPDETYCLCFEELPDGGFRRLHSCKGPPWR
jgi:hypothetical protein